MSRRRARGKVPPTPEQVIEDFTAWLIKGGVSPAVAKRTADDVREFHREAEVDPLTLTQADLVGLIAECDRQLEELDREEAEELADTPPGEPQH